MEEEKQEGGKENEVVRLTLTEYHRLVTLAAAERPGVLAELKVLLDAASKRINKHFVLTCLLIWEVLFYDKHAKDSTPDSMLELIQHLLSIVGGG